MFITVYLLVLGNGVLKIKYSKKLISNVFFIAFGPFLTYTAVLLAKRFLLSGQCFKLLSDSEVRVSHKILAMSCLGNLALYLPKFADITLQPKGDYLNIRLRFPVQLGSYI